MNLRLTNGAVYCVRVRQHEYVGARAALADWEIGVEFVPGDERALTGILVAGIEPDSIRSALVRGALDPCWASITEKFA